MTIGRVVLVALLCLFAAGCTVPQKGWSCAYHTDYVCTPNSGMWLGFYVGMTEDSAAQAACAAIKKDQLYWSDEILITDRGCRFKMPEPQSGEELGDRVEQFDTHLAFWDRHCIGGDHAEYLALYFNNDHRLVKLNTICPPYWL
jgi:hypothetical protein